jgi:hypothetical protein
MDNKRKGHPRDIGNIGHKTQIEDKQNKKYNTENLNMSNTDTNIKLEVNPGS